MSEQPKTFWTRPWKGRRGNFFWFGLLAGVVFLGVFLLALIGGPVSPVSEHLAVAAIVTVFALVLVGLARWFCSWWRFRWGLFAVACLITLFALLHAVENWGGKRSWNNYKREQEAKGEVFDLLALAPPPVPDGQNFFNTPLWQSHFFTKIDGHIVWRDPEGPVRPILTVQSPGSKAPKTGDWLQGKRTDLAEWQAYFRGRENVFNDNGGQTNFFPVAPRPQTPAEDVLLALSRFEKQLAELRNAADRPHARFPVNYEDGFSALLPHLGQMKRATQFLALHAAAKLDSGDTAAALGDVLLGFRLVEATRPEPILISHLVRIAQMQILLQPVWEGLAARQWSDAQLAEIGAALGDMDFLADYQSAIRGERAMMASTIDHLRHGRAKLHEVMDGWGAPGDESLSWLTRLIPSGWFHKNQLTCARLYQDMFLAAADPEQRRVFPEESEKNSERLHAMLARKTPYNILAGLMLPALEKSVQRFALIQSSIDQARVACALERHRLATGDYPETLAALAPRYIGAVPQDIINGEPLKYQWTGGDHFVLYSVGWNTLDDGGEAVLDRRGESVDLTRGDWVWRYRE